MLPIQQHIQENNEKVKMDLDIWETMLQAYVRWPQQDVKTEKPWQKRQKRNSRLGALTTAKCWISSSLSVLDFLSRLWKKKQQNIMLAVVS